MAENDGRYGFGVTLTDESVKRVAEEVKKEFQGMSQSAAQEGAKMESSFRKIGTALGVGFSLKAAADFGKQIVKVRGEIESLEVSFRTLLGSEQKATALMTDIRKFAATTPMQLNDLASGAQTLLGFNIEAEKVMPTLKALGDISMGDSQKFQSLTLAFAQMSSTGKLMGQDLLQMINAGFNPLVQIAERTGKSVAELKEEMSQGKISVEMVTQAFMDATSEGGKFYNMLEKQSKGIQGSLSNLKGAFDDMLNDIGENSDGVITKSVQGLTKLVQNYETVGKVIGTLVATYGSYKAAVMAYDVIATISNGLTAGLTAKEIIHAYTLGLVEKAQKLLNATMLKNPYVLAATALISLVSALVIFSKRASEAEKAQKALDNAIEGSKQRSDELKQKSDELIGVLEDENATEYAHAVALEQLKALFPGLLDHVKTYNDYLEHRKAILEGMPEAQEEKENETLQESIKLYERYIRVKKDALYKNGESYQQHDERINRDYGSSQKRYEEEMELRKKIDEEYKKWKEAGNKGTLDEFVKMSFEADKKVLEDRQKMQKQAKWDAMPIEQKIAVKTEQLEAAQREVKRLQDDAGDPRKNKFAFNTELDNALNRVSLLKGEIKSLQDEVAAAPVVDFASLQKDTRKAYNDMLAAQRAYRKSPTKANEEAYDKAKESFDTYDKQYEKATGKKYSDQLKSSKDRAKEQKELNNALKKEQEEYAKWLKQQGVEAEFEARQAGIDAMKEGLDKTIAQINLDYDRQKATIEAREEEMVEKLRDLKEAERNAQNPTKKKNGEKFDRSTVTAADLTQDQLTAYTEQALAERNRLEREAMDEMTGAKKTYLAQQAEMERQYLEARKLLVEKGATDDDLALFDRTYQANQKALFNEMLGDYVSYQQQMTDYTEEYENKRAELEELMAKTNDPTKKKNIKQAIDMLEKEYKRGFSNLQRTFIEDNIGDVFVEATYENVKEAIQKLTEMEGYKDAAEFNAKYGTNITDAEFSSFIANVKKVKREIQDLGKGGYTLRDAFKDAFSGKTKEDMEKGTQTLIAGFQKVGSIVSGLASAMRDFANATENAHLEKMADTFESIADTISTAGGYAAAGAQIGGGWGAVIGAVLGIGQGVITAIFKSEAEEKAEAKQRKEEAQDYLQDVIDKLGSLIGSVDSLHNTIASLDYSNYRKSLLETINSFRADAGYNSNNNWRSLRNGADTDYIVGNGLLDDDHIRKILRDYLWSTNGHDYSVYSYVNGLSSEELRDLFYRTYRDASGSNATAIINKIKYEYANQYNHQDYELDQKRLDLIREMMQLYEQGSLSAMDYFKMQQKADQLSLEMLRQKRAELIGEGKSETDAEIVELDNQIAELTYSMHERVREMFEGLAGIDLQSLVNKWLDIFKEFGNNMTTVFDKVDESIDDMIRNIIYQTFFVQPLMQRLNQIIKNYENQLRQQQNLGEDDIVDWTQANFIEIAESFRGVKEEMAGMWNTVMEQMNLAGIDFNSASSRTAAAHGIATASQESVDELNGRMTAVQGHTFDIRENTNIMRDMVVSINGSVHQIEIHTQHLIRMDNDIHNLKASFDTIINSNGIRIRN